MSATRVVGPLAVLGLVGAVALSACSSGTSAGTSTTPSTTTTPSTSVAVTTTAAGGSGGAPPTAAAAPVDVCATVSAADVGAAAGASGLVAQAGGGTPDPGTCYYQLGSSTYQYVEVSVEAGKGGSLARLREAAGGTSVSGVGDEAYSIVLDSNGGNQIVVRSGTNRITVTAKDVNGGRLSSPAIPADVARVVITRI